ncbi:PPE domain-containing protein, partial [Saccharomonospora saliphila]|uniref:PPE domain-containing protein n=1 Tax=Saccharomonospora saliphila TaxID=369829 RepID=UPI0012FA5AD8
MPLFLVPILAGAAGAAAGYGMATQEESGNFSGGDGSRQIDAYQIYQQLTSGPGTSSLQEGQRAASGLKRTFSERVQQMEELAGRMDQAWQGDSADAAKVGARPLKEWLMDSEVKLHDSDRAMGSQAEAFTGAVSRVQPVPKTPPESDFINDMKPWTTDTDRAIQDYNAKAQANVDAFNAYYQATTANSQSLPTYSGLDGDIGEIEVDENAGSGPGQDGQSGQIRSLGPTPGTMPGSIAGGGGGGGTPGGSGGGLGGGGYTPPSGGGGGDYAAP